VLTLRIGTRSSRALMRWCALTIAILAILPFTPPFSTCDLNSLVADRTLQKEAPSEGQSSGPSIADAAFFLASVGDDKEHLKNLASAVAVQLPFAVSANPAGPSPSLVPVPHDQLSLVASSVLRI